MSDATCHVCGYHLIKTGDKCPNCEKMKKAESLPNQSMDIDAGDLIFCDTCGNNYHATESKSGLCPHCVSIRQKSSTNRIQNDRKEKLRLDDENRARQQNQTVKQVYVEDKSAMTKYIPIGIAVVAAVGAVIAFVFMG